MIRASAGRGRPTVAGRSGPPVRASGSSASSVPAASGARRPALLERVARGPHRLPDAQAAQFPQAVALHGDAGARRGDLRLDVDQVDRDPAGGEADGGRAAGQAGPAISTRLTADVAARLPMAYLLVSSHHYRPGKGILEIDC